jgi:hypothetical protein
MDTNKRKEYNRHYQWLRYNKNKEYREKRKAISKKYYKDNQEEILNKVHKRRLVDRFSATRASTNYYNAHWEKVREYQKNYYKRKKHERINNSKQSIQNTRILV